MEHPISWLRKIDKKSSMLLVLQKVELYVHELVVEMFNAEVSIVLGLFAGPVEGGSVQRSIQSLNRMFTAPSPNPAITSSKPTLAFVFNFHHGSKTENHQDSVFKIPPPSRYASIMASHSSLFWSSSKGIWCGMSGVKTFVMFGSKHCAIIFAAGKTGSLKP